MAAPQTLLYVEHWRPPFTYGSGRSKQKLTGTLYLADRRRVCFALPGGPEECEGPGCLAAPQALLYVEHGGLLLILHGHRAGRVKWNNVTRQFTFETKPQSNDFLTRGPPELVQHSRL